MSINDFRSTIQPLFRQEPSLELLLHRISNSATLHGVRSSTEGLDIPATCREVASAEDMALLKSLAVYNSVSAPEYWPQTASPSSTHTLIHRDCTGESTGNFVLQDAGFVINSISSVSRVGGGKRARVCRG